MFKKKDDEPVTIRQRAAAPPWTYVAESPFFVQVMCEKDMIALHQFKRIDNAVAWFARFNLPMVRPRTVAILDKHRQLVLCYDAEIDGTITWGGTAQVFDVLERFYDPTEVLVWRTEASAGVQI